MSKEIAGKKFSSLEEEGLEPLSDEELERAEQMFAEARARIAAVPPEEPRQASRKFYDDTSGTEFEQR
ncbi:hypothetical protein F5X71_04565 [Nocardia brasiliensis]|uniref:Uncharacterized protein n=1 Tax=Nocardia brasiliensis TaxID=37326 RepID=A0A6G9XL89_NOCBR|nr:hypothetical protein [Nocardia brasiliensis]QIS01677.1 hypothetical protein F5X71_04565 [Nocardia brasiliensis]